MLKVLVFFGRMSKIMDRLLSEAPSPMCSEKKVEKLQLHMQKKSYKFCKINYSKYGFDGLSQCFCQFCQFIFLEYFFPEHLLNDASKYLQYLS